MSILRPLILTLITFFSVSAAQAATYFFHTDHLGTPRVLSDKDQNVVWQGEYSPFGGVTETVSTVEQSLRFPGQYFDVETGLYYNYFRDYDPALGRYVEADPIGVLKDFSIVERFTPEIAKDTQKIGNASSITPLNLLFGYAEQNPNLNIDPKGLECLNKKVRDGCFAIVCVVLSMFDSNPGQAGRPAPIEVHQIQLPGRREERQ